MERIMQYRQAIRQLLATQVAVDQGGADSEVDCQVVMDTENDHYQLLDVGWEGLKRVYSCFVHIDIKDDNVWIQRNMTEVELGLHPAYNRLCTGYGVA
jgi:XisI protein